MKAVTVTAHGGTEVLAYGDTKEPEVSSGHLLVPRLRA